MNVAVEAGAGFGKTVLLRIAAEQHGYALAATFDEVEAAMGDRGRPVAVDAIERWSDDEQRALDNLIEQTESSRRWLVAGRLLSAVPSTAGWRRIGTDDLRFDASQVATLATAHEIHDQTLIDTVSHLSAGWPTAAHRIVVDMADADDPAVVARDLGRHNAVLESLISGLIDPAGPDGAAATTLAALPFFDEAIADLVGGDRLLDRLATAGLAIGRSTGGRIEFLEPARTALQSRSNRGPLPSAIVEHFVADHKIHAALDTCLAYGERERAAELLASLNRQHEAHLDPVKLHATVAALGTAVERHPRALYIHAHVSAVHGHGTESLRSIERGAAIFAGRDPDLADEDHIETMITLGVWRVFGGQLPEAKTILDRVAAAIDPSSLRLNAMRHDLTGLLHHALGSDDDLRLATDELKAAYNLWRQLNEPEAATVTVFRLASGVLASRGQRREALALLDDLPNLGPMSLHTTARQGLERALLLPYLGRAAEVEDALRETKRISLLLDDRWTYSLAMVTELVAASIEGDGDGVVARSRALVDEGHFTFATVAEGLHWLDVADALARCERWDEAREAVEVIRGVRDIPDWMVMYSEASIEARCGDSAQALELLATLDLRHDVEVDKRWQLRLYAATAHRRAGRADEAAKALEAAYSDAAALGAPELPNIVERRLVEMIATDKRQGAGPEIEALTVHLFGSLRVERGRQQVAVPTGNASTLLKLLASAQDSVTIDQAIEAIWPGTSLEAGRRRLRNVVMRVREACGEVIEREGDLIGLVSGIRCDYADAAAAARRVLREPAAGADELSQTLEQLDRPLLKDAAYEDWAETVRDEQRRLLVELLDRLGEVTSTVDRSAARSYLMRASELDHLSNPGRDRTIQTLGTELT